MRKDEAPPTGGMPETMLITLWAKAEETTRENGLFRDSKAIEIVRQIDYDFSVFQPCWKSQLGVAVRSMILDGETKRFIDAHPDGAVVNLGAGLDTRMERLGAEAIDWYDLDLPEGIARRRQFFRETERRRFIARSVFDFSWMDEIGAAKKTPLFIAEGLLMYFPEEQVRSLFVELARRFPKGEMLFETTAPFVVGKARWHDSLSKVGKGLEFLWGPDNPESVADWSEAIRFLGKWNYYDYAVPRWRWMRIFRHIPALRRVMSSHIVHIGFNDLSRKEGSRP